MPTDKSPKRSSLGLIVLWQLYAQPMHAYGIQKMLESQGKDRVVNVRTRSSLYQTIDRLMRLGLIEIAETIDGDGYPDRVVYAITDAGREVAREWLREMLRTTDGEYPEFIAAMSMIFCLPQDEARAELELRARRLAAQLAESERSVADSPPQLPRLFLLEEEYRITTLRAELAWVTGVVEDLRTGRLAWSEEWLRELAAAFLPGDEDDNEEDR